MEKKKVLFVNTSLSCGGAEKLLVDILRNIDYDRFDVTLLYFTAQEFFLSDIPHEVKIIRLFGYKTLLWKFFYHPLKHLGLLDCYHRYMLRKSIGQFDTIVSFLEGFALKMHTYITDKSKLNITFVHTDLEVNPESYKIFGSEEKECVAYNQMDRIIFVSGNAETAFRNKYPSVKSDIVVLRNFIDVEEVQKLGKTPKYEKSNFTIASLGRMTKVKGLDFFILIIEEFKKRYGNNFTVRMIGDGPEMETVKSDIEKHNLTDNIILEGFCKNPYPILASCDVLISTSLTEGLPLSFCEAMALGLPVLATINTGSKEVVDNCSGVLLERDIYAFCDHLEKLATSEEVYSKMKDGAISRSRDFSKEKYMSELHKLLYKI